MCVHSIQWKWLTLDQLIFAPSVATKSVTLACTIPKRNIQEITKAFSKLETDIQEVCSCDKIIAVLQEQITDLRYRSMKYNPIFSGLRYAPSEKTKRRRSDPVLWQKPLHQQKCQRGKVTTQTTPQKSSIKQQLRTDLGRPVGVTTATQLVWLTWFTGPPSHSPVRTPNTYSVVSYEMNWTYTKIYRSATYIAFVSQA